MELNQVTVPCTDYSESVRFYQQLGLKQIVDSPPRYARFESDSGSTFSIHAVGSEFVPSQVVVYFEVADVDSRVAALESSGLKFDSLPVDQSWLWREAHIRDPAGNRICLFHAGTNRRFPPWRITPQAAGDG